MENIDIDFIDKDFVMVDPEWSDKPDNFDIFDMDTWPEGMVYPDIPKIIKPDYIAKTKYFSRLYDIILSCKSNDEIKIKIFKFISLEEPHFFESVVGHDNVHKWNYIKVDVNSSDNNVNKIKSHKIQILKSMVGNKLLKKYSITQQINNMSDSFFSLKTLSGFTDMAENDLLALITSKVGSFDNIIDLNNVQIGAIDFSDILSNLKDEFQASAAMAEEALLNIAESVLAHQKISAMRKWSKAKVNEIISSGSTDEVVELMHNIRVPEV